MKLSLNKDLTPFKDEARKKINEKRDAVLYKGINITATAFTKQAFVQVRGTPQDYSYLMILKLKSDMKVIYHDAYNTDHELNIDQVKSLVSQYEAWYDQVFAKSWEAKKKIEAALSPAEIESVLKDYLES